MTQHRLSNSEMTETLHPVFDQQIMNYGAYNLVFATGSSIYRNPDIAATQQPDQQYFLLGYRESPRELVIAPLALPEVLAAGQPTSIDNTNAVRAYALNDETFGIDSTNGSSFILTLKNQIQVETELGTGELDQEHDVEDFLQFLVDSWLEEAL